MKNKLIGVHGFTGSSKGDWFPWLRTEFEKEDFEVIIHDLPNSQNPIIESWISSLAESIQFETDENTYFIGHSLGCQTILRYLHKFPPKEKVGGAIFVAGFFDKLTNLDVDEARILSPWLEEKIEFDQVRSRMKKSIAIFSENDSWVPLTESKRDFEDKLGSEIITLSNMGHFSGDDGLTSFPLLKSIFESRFVDDSKESI